MFLLKLVIFQVFHGGLPDCIFFQKRCWWWELKPTVQDDNEEPDPDARGCG